MKIFFKPTKKIIIIFIGLVLVNISLPFLGFILSDLTDLVLFDYLLILGPIYQIVGLAVLFRYLGVNVESRGGEAILPIAHPNFLGGVLIIAAVIANLTILYLLACYFSVHERKNENKY